MWQQRTTNGIPTIHTIIGVVPQLVEKPRHHRQSDRFWANSTASIIVASVTNNAPFCSFYQGECHEIARSAKREVVLSL